MTREEGLQPPIMFGRPAGWCGAARTRVPSTSCWCTAPATTTGPSPKGNATRARATPPARSGRREEETGLTCRLGSELPSTRYHDNKGRPKTVRYWAMEPVAGDGEFTPNAEIDEIRWLPIPQAVKLLSYDHDRPVVQAFAPSHDR